MDFGDRVRTLRMHLGLTGEEFGSHIGLTKNQVSLIENNERRLQLEALWQIAKTWSVDVRWFFGLITRPEDAIKADADTTYTLEEVVNRLDRIERKISPVEPDNPAIAAVLSSAALRELVTKLHHLKEERVREITFVVEGYLHNSSE